MRRGACWPAPDASCGMSGGPGCRRCCRSRRSARRTTAATTWRWGPARRASTPAASPGASPAGASPGAASPGAAALYIPHVTRATSRAPGQRQASLVMASEQRSLPCGVSLLAWCASAAAPPQHADASQRVLAGLRAAPVCAPTTAQVYQITQTEGWGMSADASWHLAAGVLASGHAGKVNWPCTVAVAEGAFICSRPAVLALGEEPELIITVKLC